LKKNIQHNGQKKKYKRINNDRQNIHIKIYILVNIIYARTSTIDNNTQFNCTVRPVLRGHHCDKEIVALLDRWPLKRGSINIKCSMTGQEKGGLLIQVTA
jgi:hypothetical protein